MVVRPTHLNRLAVIYIRRCPPNGVRYSKVPLCDVAANWHGRCARAGNFAVAHPSERVVLYTKGRER